MPGRVVLPIRRRNRGHRQKKVDPYLLRMTHGVMMICLGFFMMAAGMLMTIFGHTNWMRTKEIQPMLIIGPICLFLGLVFSVVGGAIYGVNYRRKQKRDRGGADDQELHDQTNGKLDVAEGDVTVKLEEQRELE